MKIPIVTAARRFGRLLGGNTTLPILTECEDGREYAVKLPSEGARLQFLVNELFASLLIREFGLPGVEPALVNVPKEVNGEHNLPTSHVERLREARAVFGMVPCVASLYENNSQEFGEGPDLQAMLHDAMNWDTILGAVVFDTWVFNEDARQFLVRKTLEGRWTLMLFDNEGAFNRNDWLLQHDRCRASTKSDVLNKRLEDLVKKREIAPFECHVNRLEKSMNRELLTHVANLIPCEWLNAERLNAERLDNRRAYGISGLVNALDCRRRQVRRLLQDGLL